MSRSIKFRAWDKEAGDWYAVDEADINIALDGKVWGCMKGDDEWCDMSDIIELQQFTGLLDKNGVEIYEGDICKYSSTNFIGRVEYHTSPRVEFYLFGETDNHELYSTADLEVIGNVYENPELLESEQR